MKISLLLTALFCTGASGAQITLSPSAQTVPISASAIVNINISGLGNGAAPSLGAYDLSVSFDPILLSLSSVSWGTGLDIFGLGDIQASTPGLGSIELLEVSLDSASDLNSLQPAAFTLFSLNFSALAVGSSALTVAINALGDAEGNALAADVNTGSITVADGTPNPVPEPSYLAPVLLGLGTIVAAKRRRGLPVS